MGRAEPPDAARTLDVAVMRSSSRLAYGAQDAIFSQTFAVALPHVALRFQQPGWVNR